MSTVTRDPFDAFTPIRDAVARFMEDGLVSPERLFAIGRTFPVDVLDLPEEYVIEATITGVKPEDIHITAEGNTITLRTGGRISHAGSREGTYLRRERLVRPTPEICRTLTLPTRIDPDKIAATYEHGVLTVKIAKTEESKAHTIQVVNKEAKAHR
jgi:HSP20 family protein